MNAPPDDAPPFPDLKRVRLLARALRGGWRVPLEKRAGVLAELAAVLADDTPRPVSARERMTAARALLDATSQDQAADFMEAGAPVPRRWRNRGPCA